MEKTRVKKLEKYWCVQCEYDVYPHQKVDYEKDTTAEHHYKIGNYFHTEEQAEAMAEKIRKILKGAIVIDKLPSEEEIWDEANKRYPRRWSGDRENSEKFDVFMEGAEWLKSQLTKDG